jgi:hypothetical protein
VENRFNHGIAVFRGGSWHGEFLCPRLLFVVLVPLFDFTDLRQELGEGWWVGSFSDRGICRIAHHRIVKGGFDTTLTIDFAPVLPRALFWR